MPSPARIASTQMYSRRRMASTSIQIWKATKSSAGKRLSQFPPAVIAWIIVQAERTTREKVKQVCLGWQPNNRCRWKAREQARRIGGLKRDADWSLHANRLVFSR